MIQGSVPNLAALEKQSQELNTCAYAIATALGLTQDGKPFHGNPVDLTRQIIQRCDLLEDELDQIRTPMLAHLGRLGENGEDKTPETCTYDLVSLVITKFRDQITILKRGQFPNG